VSFNNGGSWITPVSEKGEELVFHVTDSSETQGILWGKSELYSEFVIGNGYAPEV
jgi:hypothetical protein